jgi:hypothetical protein
MVMNWFTANQHVKEELAGVCKMDEKKIQKLDFALLPLKSSP